MNEITLLNLTSTPEDNRFAFSDFIPREYNPGLFNTDMMTDKNDDFANFTFPHKLYILLEKENPDIITWALHGKVFKIIDITRFQNEIIPKYFKRKLISLNSK